MLGAILTPGEVNKTGFLLHGVLGETKLTSFSARAGGARIRGTLSGDESANRFHCSLRGVSFHPTRPAQEGTKSVTLH